MNSTRYLSYVNLDVLAEYIKKYIRENSNKKPLSITCSLISYDDQIIEMYATASRLFKHKTFRCSLSDFSCTIADEKITKTNTTDFINYIHKYLLSLVRLKEIPSEIPLKYLTNYNEAVSPNNSNLEK